MEGGPGWGPGLGQALLGLATLVPFETLTLSDVPLSYPPGRGHSVWTSAAENRASTWEQLLRAVS